MKGHEQQHQLEMFMVLRGLIESIKPCSLLLWSSETLGLTEHLAREPKRHAVEQAGKPRAAEYHAGLSSRIRDSLEKLPLPRVALAVDRDISTLPARWFNHFRRNQSLVAPNSPDLLGLYFN